MLKIIFKKNEPDNKIIYYFVLKFRKLININK